MEEIQEIIHRGIKELNEEFVKLSNLRKSGYNIRKDLDRLAWRCSRIAEGLNDDGHHHAVMTVFYSANNLLYKHYGEVSKAPVPRGPKPRIGPLEIF